MSSQIFRSLLIPSHSFKKDSSSILKKSIIIFLLLVLTSPFWGTYIFFHIKE